eukprot:3886287-Alexandrium_andersonii.AAC.1
MARLRCCDPTARSQLRRPLGRLSGGLLEALQRPPKALHGLPELPGAPRHSRELPGAVQGSTREDS